MSRTLTQALAWTNAHPTRENVPGAKWRLLYGWSWDQLCAAYVYWAMGAASSFASAKVAFYASGPKHMTKTNIPDGAIVWFKIGLYWHVGWVYHDRVYMASHRVTHKVPNGVALGWMTVQQYLDSSHAEWGGWSMDFGGSRFAGLLDTAGTGTTKPVPKPAPSETKEEPPMSRRLLRWHTDSTDKTKNTYLRYEASGPILIDYATARNYNEYTGTVSITQEEKETTAAWKARQKAIAADWKAQAAREIAAFHAQPVTIDYAALAAEVAKTVPSTKSIVDGIIAWFRRP